MLILPDQEADNGFVLEMENKTGLQPIAYFTKKELKLPLVNSDRRMALPFFFEDKEKVNKETNYART
jgi:hypothetical protein